MAFKCPPGQGSGVKCHPVARSDIAGFAVGATTTGSGWTYTGNAYYVFASKKGTGKVQYLEVVGTTLADAQARAAAEDTRTA